MATQDEGQQCMLDEVGSVLTALLLPPNLLERNSEWHRCCTMPRSRRYWRKEEPLTIIMKGIGHVVKHGEWTTELHRSKCGVTVAMTV